MILPAELVTVPTVNLVVDVKPSKFRDAPAVPATLRIVPPPLNPVAVRVKDSEVMAPVVSVYNLLVVVPVPLKVPLTNLGKAGSVTAPSEPVTFKI